MPMKRQIPRPGDLRPLVQFKRPVVNPARRRLDAALTIGDLRRIARRRTPRAAFDYADGAAEAEISLARARRAFAGLQFNPAILRDVSTVEVGWEVLGKRAELPFGIAPTGFTRMMHAEGERAGAAAAAAAGIPFTLSTMGTTSIEDVAAIALGARFTMVGRACLYGLMAGGRAGVDRVITILKSDIVRTMRLLGATSLEELAPHHVTLPSR